MSESRDRENAGRAGSDGKVNSEGQVMNKSRKRGKSGQERDANGKDVIKEAKALLRPFEKAASVEEAKTAMGRIRTLLAKHNLSSAKLSRQKDQSSVEITVTYADKFFRQKYRWERFERTLLEAVAVLTNTILHEIRSKLSASSNAGMFFVGDEVDVTIAVDIASVLLNIQRRAAKAYVGKGRGPERRYHALGFADAIYESTIRLKNKPPNGWSKKSCKVLLRIKDAKFQWVCNTMKERNPAMGPVKA